MEDSILVKHMEEDARFQDETRNVHTEIFKKIDGLATKEDAEKILNQQSQMMEFMKSVNIGIGIFKFSWNNAAKIGSFLALLGGIFLLFKYGAAAVLVWVLNGFKR